MNNEAPQLGNYQLVRLLGKGGFGDIYLGEHVYLRTIAAIKVLNVRLSENQLQEFHKEAIIIANLTHPHIVHVLDFGVQDNTIPYLVMQYAPKGTLLSHHPRGTALEPAKVAFYIKQIAEALQYAHDRNIIHRDIKPENVLMESDDNVLLSDFGLAKITSGLSNKSLNVSGTPYYIAPEQWNGKSCFASDQYALAILAYELLTGHFPFDGPSPEELMNQHFSAQPQSLTKLRPGIPRDLENVILQGLAKKPEDRFASISAFASAIQRAATGSDTTTRDVTIAAGALIGLAGGAVLLTNQWLKKRKAKKLAEFNAALDTPPVTVAPKILPKELFANTLDNLGNTFIKDCVEEAQTSIDTDPDWANRLRDWFQWAALTYVHNVQRVTQEAVAQLKPQAKIVRFAPGKGAMGTNSGPTSGVDDRITVVASWIGVLLAQPTGADSVSLGSELDTWSKKLASVKDAKQETIKLVRKTAERLSPLLNAEATRYLLEIDRRLSAS